MSGNSVKPLIKNVIKSIAAIALALAFFSVFLMILNVAFPSGPSFKELMGGKEDPEPASLVQESLPGPFPDSGEKEGAALGKEEAAAPEKTVKSAAVLTRKRKDVKSRRAQAIAWTAAQEGMPLYDRDAVQTFKRSGARITFDPKNYIGMGPNSLVIIQRLEEEIILREKRSFLMMVEGDLLGRIEEDENKTTYVEVTTPSAVARIRSEESEDHEAEYRITVNDDDSSTISVFHGIADVTAQGETVRVEANESSFVPLGEAPGEPVALPPPPILIQPNNEEVFTYRDLPPRIKFLWEPPALVGSHHMVLSEDPDFVEILYEETVTRPDFSHGNLKNGTYYWKVSSVKGKTEGGFSPAREVRVVQDLEAPVLEVDFPSGTVNQEQFVLTGKAEPGSRVLVGGNPVSITEAGRFEFELSLKDGANVIVVEAVDDAGNVAYLSEFIYGKF